MGVVPVRSGVRRLKLIREALPGRNGALRNVGRAIHESVALLEDPVPVEAGRLIVQLVRDVDDYLVPGVDLEVWAGPLAVDTLVTRVSLLSSTKNEFGGVQEGETHR